MILKPVESRGAVVASVVVAMLAASAGGCASNPLRKHREALKAEGRWEMTGARDGLALSTHPRKDVFRGDETVLIDVRLTNVTNTLGVPVDINVYSEIATEGLLLYLDLYRIDERRKRVHLTAPFRPGVEERMKRYPHCAKLQPGFFIGRPLQFGDFPPGIYELTATYDNQYDLCPLSPRLTLEQIKLLETDSGNEGFVKLWKGMLTSNTVVFQVLERENPRRP